MKLLLSCLLNVFLVFNALGQHEADNWFFGLNAGITFASGTPVMLTGGMLQTPEGCASISDANGNLLFYSEGNVVWAANHSVMPNGTGLNGSLTCSQSALVVPHPGNSSQYFIFTPPDQFSTATFRYSIIDMTLNNGLGDVINKNTTLFNPSTEKVTAVRHANGTSIWLMTHAFGSNNFHAFEISAAGVSSTAVISSAGSVHAGTSHNKIGIMKASPCGDKIALTVLDSSFVELFDFDNATGIVSNGIRVGNFVQNNAWGLYGLEFSPNGSRLYVTQENPAVLVQYDVWAGSAAAIIASADTIVYNPGTNFGTLQNGPDGKMYVSRFTNSFLACINEPDNLGLACNYTDQAVSLGSATGAHGLPNFVTSYFCPPTLGVTEQSELQISIYPVPASENLNVIINGAGNGPLVMRLFDAQGRLHNETSKNATHNNQEHQLEIGNYSPGFYFLQIINEQKVYVNPVIIE